MTNIIIFRTMWWCLWQLIGSKKIFLSDTTGVEDSYFVKRSETCCFDCGEIFMELY